MDEEPAAPCASFAGSDETYGSRRVLRDLLAWGIDCGLHRVERLMRLRGLKRAKQGDASLTISASGTRLPPTCWSGHLRRAGPNLKWAADFTYLWTHEGWLFVAVVIDLFSRRVVGWSSNARMTAQLVMDALMTAVWRRGSPRTVLHHSDQGSQYSSERFQDLLTEHGIDCSTSRTGNCGDNALNVSEIKRERHELFVQKGKGDKPRSIPIPEALFTELLAYLLERGKRGALFRTVSWNGALPTKMSEPWSRMLPHVQGFAPA